MGRYKLKPISPLMLPIKKNDYVLFDKELYKVIAVNRSMQYTIERIKDGSIKDCIENEDGYRAAYIYAKDLSKITNKAAKVLYGV